MYVHSLTMLNNIRNRPIIGKEWNNYIKPFELKPDTTVIQTIRSSATTMGNCYASSLSSLLSIPISDVPDFRPRPNEEYDQDDHVRNWLLSFGYDLIKVPGNAKFPGFCLGSGLVTRSIYLGHVVVMKDGKQFYDPHPTHQGIVNIYRTIIIAPVANINYEKIQRLLFNHKTNANRQIELILKFAPSVKRFKSKTYNLNNQTRSYIAAKQSEWVDVKYRNKPLITTDLITKCGKTVE